MPIEYQTLAPCCVTHLVSLSHCYRGFQVACQTVQTASAKSTYVKCPLIRFVCAVGAKIFDRRALLNFLPLNTKYDYGARSDVFSNLSSEYRITS